MPFITAFTTARCPEPDEFSASIVFETNFDAIITSIEQSLLFRIPATKPCLHFSSILHRFFFSYSSFSSFSLFLLLLLISPFSPPPYSSSSPSSPSPPPTPPPPSPSSSSSSITLQSNADLRLPNRILPVSSVFFYLSFHFVILRLLVSVCTQFHHLFLGRPPLHLIPIDLIALFGEEYKSWRHCTLKNLRTDSSLKCSLLLPCTSGHRARDPG